MRLVKRCTKHDLKELQKIALATHILPLVLLSWASLDTLSSSPTFQSTTLLLVHRRSKEWTRRTIHKDRERERITEHH